jgi:hypothetical protein
VRACCCRDACPHAVTVIDCCRGLQRHERGSKASKTKINPYFKFELGGTNSIKKRSTPIKNSNSTPDFKGEVCARYWACCLLAFLGLIRLSTQEMQFDITAPKTLLQNGDMLLRFEVCFTLLSLLACVCVADAVLLPWQVWNDSTFSDDMIGQGVISVMEYFENRALKRCVLSLDGLQPRSVLNMS